MKMIMLSTKPGLYSTKRLQEAALNRNHEMVIINTTRCYMHLNTTGALTHYRGKRLNQYDALIPRVGASTTIYGTSLIRQFEMMNIFCLNPSAAISKSRDKFHSLQLLTSEGIPLPITGFAHSLNDIDDLIAMVGGAPLIIKLIQGTQGIGVVVAETKQAAESVIQTFLGLKVNIMVQEFITETQGQDIRCFVINDKVVAAMLRQAKPGDFRSNIHRGGIAKPIKITDEERDIAVHAVRTIGLNIAGVDLLRSNRGPLVLEVNSTPGLEGIEQITHQDIAGNIITFIEQKCQ